MGAVSPKSGHELTHEDNVKGGKNSKRGPSVKTIVQEVGSEMTSDELAAKVREKYGIDVSNTTILKAMAKAAAARALLDGSTQDWKEFNDRHDGKAKQEIEMSGKIDIEAREKLTKEFLEKHGLAKRA